MGGNPIVRKMAPVKLEEKLCVTTAVVMMDDDGCQSLSFPPVDLTWSFKSSFFRPNKPQFVCLQLKIRPNSSRYHSSPVAVSTPPIIIVSMIYLTTNVRVHNSMFAQISDIHQPPSYHPQLCSSAYSVAVGYSGLGTL